MPNSFWKKVWKTPGTSLQKENLKPTVKFGDGSGLVWGIGVGIMDKIVVVYCCDIDFRGLYHGLQSGGRMVMFAR